MSGADLEVGVQPVSHAHPAICRHESTTQWDSISPWVEANTQKQLEQFASGESTRAIPSIAW